MKRSGDLLQNFSILFYVLGAVLLIFSGLYEIYLAFSYYYSLLGSLGILLCIIPPTGVILFAFSLLFIG